MTCDRVVSRRHLEVEPRGEHVLGQHLARAARYRERERDARDRAVLHALRAGGADEREAARLEIEHRLPLGLAHQRFRAAARGEAHLDAARGVRGREERLRPRCVVAVDEHGLGAVYRERLGVGHEPQDGEPQVQALLDRALGEDTRPAGLRADEDRERVQRGVAGDADRRLHLGEPAGGGLRGIGGEQRRVLLQVRDVGLVRGSPPGAQLLQREHQLDRVEHADDPREPRRRQPAREADEVVPQRVDVHEPSGDLRVVERGGLARRPGRCPSGRRTGR